MWVRYGPTSSATERAWVIVRGPGVQDMGMEMPSDFSAERVGEAVGWGERVRTIDVATQQAGPRLTLGYPPPPLLETSAGGHPAL